MSNRAQAKWIEFRDATCKDSADEPAARFFFYAGMQIMYQLISEAPQNEIDRALFMNELQRELLEDMRDHQESTNGNAPVAG